LRKILSGSDTIDEPYYELYSKIQNHFIEKPNDACYVCLYPKGFYNSVPSVFPGIKELDKHCLNSEKEIGTTLKLTVKENKLKTEYEIVKRDKNVRIFIDKKEINLSNKVYKINCMTLNEFAKRYLNKLYEKEKGLSNNIDKNYYLKDKKMIRNLIKISYRLLNLNDYKEFEKTFRNIYKIFIEKQNNDIKDALNAKIKDGILSSNFINKINAQQNKEDEIFTFKPSENFLLLI
jgi:hypothetical protein